MKEFKGWREVGDKETVQMGDRMVWVADHMNFEYPNRTTPETGIKCGWSTVGARRSEVYIRDGWNLYRKLVFVMNPNFSQPLPLP